MGRRQAREPPRAHIALDASDHLETSYDPVAMADVLNALDPAQLVRVPCLLVLPVFGPVGAVPPS